MRPGWAAGASTSRPAARPRARPRPARSCPTGSRPRANTASSCGPRRPTSRQEDAYIFSYSGGVMSRNVTLAQRAYQYEALGALEHHGRQWRAGAADARRRPRRAGLAAARRADLRSGQRPPPLRQRQLHRRRGSARRRLAGGLGRHLRAGARQRDLQQPPVAGRDPLRRGPQPRADAVGRSSRTSRPASASATSCCSTCRR